MKKKKYFMLSAILSMFLLLGFGMAYNKGVDFKGMDILIFVVIIVIAGIAMYTSYKKDKSMEEGFPGEDEMSLQLKFKAGYYAFLSSMYIWIFILIFSSAFPDVETMIGAGVMLSILAFYIAKLSINKAINE